MASRPKIPEGLWFAVPLRDSGFGIGVVARANRGVLLGYFFGPRRKEPPALVDLSTLQADDAIWVSKFGYLGLRDGDWPVIGALENWKRDAWPMPVFARHEEVTGRWLQVVYDDTDPNKFVREIPVSEGAAKGSPEDGLAGPGFVEIHLAGLLGT